MSCVCTPSNGVRSRRCIVSRSTSCSRQFSSPPVSCRYSRCRASCAHANIRMPRSVSSVTTRAAAQSTPVSGLAGATQTLSTPSCGAIHASRVPSGEMCGLTGWGWPSPMAHLTSMDGHPEALIDLGAIKDNASALVKHVGGAQVLAVVKADGYGHGMVPAATAALTGGASWLGVMHVAEALELRQAGLTAPVLCLLGAPDARYEEAIRSDIDLGAGSAAVVGEIVAAAGRAGRPARLHLKADTGMSRGGATVADWPGLVAAALRAEAAGRARIVGIWSHLACADIPGHPSISAQLAAFRAAVELAEKAGARPDVRHL